MDYAKVKIYTDGSHYIGIPQSHKPTRTRPKRACRGETMLQANGIESNDKTENEKSAKPTTVKEEFERLYKEISNSLSKKTIRKIIAELAPRFEDEESATAFVERNIERMERNKMERNKRFNRKIRLQQWNYFCTEKYFYGYYFCYGILLDLLLAHFLPGEQISKTAFKALKCAYNRISMLGRRLT